MAKDIAVEVLWVIATILSIALNLHLFNSLTTTTTVTPSPQPIRIPNNITKEAPAPPKDLEALPSFNGKLSHMILEVIDEDVESVGKMFKYWVKFPPCLMASQPSSWTKSEVTFTVLLPSPPSEKFTAELKSMFHALPLTVRACFRTFEIVQASLPAVTKSASLSDKIEQSRGLFAALLKNDLHLSNPNHALYINPECVPIQSNWLNLVDYHVRPPTEVFWMSGSVFRGYRSNWKKNTASFGHIGRYALYNLGDGLKDWYFGKVIPYIKDIPPPEYEFGRWEMDIFHYLADIGRSVDYQMGTSKFRLTNTIINQWNVTLNIPAIITKEPDVAIVCGIVPDLSKAF